MALFRAIESAQPSYKRLFRDPFAATFLTLSFRRLARWSALPMVGSLILRYIDALWPGARTSGVARTRLIDDWASDSVAAGSRQIIILGAGFDTRAWRLAAFAGLRVFEADHPATAAEKSRRMATVGADCSRIVSVPLDFDRESLADALARAEFDGAEPTAVIWEGVTNYLTADAVNSVFKWTGNLAHGSRLVFTYVHKNVLVDPAKFDGAAKVLSAVSSAGEPWTFGLDPRSLSQDLREYGLRLLEDLGADDYRARYFGKKARGMRGYAFYRAAVAMVAGTRLAEKK